MYWEETVPQCTPSRMTGSFKTDFGLVSREKNSINTQHIRKFGGRYALEASRGRFGGESWDVPT